MQPQNSPDNPAETTPETVSVAQLVDQLIASRSISHQEYQALYQTVMADGTVDENERRQINRLFDAIQVGMVKIIN